ncbi:transcription factor hamlet-like [Meleagris gallopavo]|uniref:transcription factor hamlet-like n=1 Tax=Meleagris gallopavo TaxID=9103 RepID=UPI00093958AD|nr:transcription factor hamlet-like [Meleagris gallopavo]
MVSLSQIVLLQGPKTTKGCPKESCEDGEEGKMYEKRLGLLVLFSSENTRLRGGLMVAAAPHREWKQEAEDSSNTTLEGFEGAKDPGILEFAEAESGASLEDETRPGGYHCSQCDRVLMSMQGLRSHERSHLALAMFTREDKYSCQYCSFVSAFRHNLDRHMQTHHGHHKPFRCKLCPFKSSYNSRLKTHILKAHADSSYSEPPDVQQQLNHYQSAALARNNNVSPIPLSGSAAGMEKRKPSSTVNFVNSPRVTYRAFGVTTVTSMEGKNFSSAKIVPFIQALNLLLLCTWKLGILQFLRKDPKTFAVLFAYITPNTNAT